MFVTSASKLIKIYTKQQTFSTLPLKNQKVKLPKKARTVTKIKLWDEMQRDAYDRWGKTIKYAEKKYRRIKQMRLDFTRLGIAKKSALYKLIYTLDVSPSKTPQAFLFSFL